MSEIEIKKVAEKALKTTDNLGIATEKAKGIALKAKEKVSESVSDNSESPVNYAVNKIQDDAKNVSEDAIYLFNKQGKKSVNKTVKNTKKLEQSIEEVRAKRKIKKDKSKVNNPDRYTPKAPDDTVMIDDIVSKNTPKNTQNKVRSASSIKTKETVSAVKSNQPIINASKQSVKDTAKAINKSSQIAKETAKQFAKGAKKAARATKRAIKAMIESTKALVNAIIAGGWVSVVIIILISLVAALCSSFYGIFFSSETSQSGMNITSVIQQINNEFDDKIDEIKSSGSFDGVEVIGSRSNWKDILSIYAVKTTTDENNPMEVATVDENKKSILSSIFWDMNNISKSVETVVLLSHKKPDGHINVKVEFGEGEGKVPLDNIAKRAESYKPKERVTYKMIKEYIEAKYGFKVHTAYIAEVKRDLGLPMYDAPNAVEELKQPRKHPTAEKVEAIKDALKHFEVI